MKFHLTILCLCALATGCSSVTTAPTTQPTAQGVLTVTALYQGLAATENGELLAYHAGQLSKAQVQASIPALAQAKADIDAANSAALAGSSGAAGLLTVASTSLANAAATTQPAK